MVKNSKFDSKIMSVYIQKGHFWSKFDWSIKTSQKKCPVDPSSAKTLKRNFKFAKLKSSFFFSLEGWLISLCHFSRWKSSFIYNYRGLMTHSPIDSFAKWLIVSHPWVILFREKMNSMWFSSRSHPPKNIPRKWNYRN